jgi:peptidylprolyl isomerase
MKRIGIFLIILSILLIGVIAFSVTGNMAKNHNHDNHNVKVRLETKKGDIVIELYSKEMPITTGNFKKLVESGFYDGTIFHRVIDGFMIQGGDPTGTGTGGPGYEIKDEFTKTSLDENDRGTISMANAGPNTGGSQFFINLVDNNHLDRKHPVFGEVIKGMDVVDAIARVATDEDDKPIEDVRIIRAEVI